MKKIALLALVAIALVVSIGAIQLHAKGTPQPSASPLYNIGDDWEITVFESTVMVCDKHISGDCRFICDWCALCLETGYSYKFHSLTDGRCPNCGAEIDE